MLNDREERENQVSVCFVLFVCSKHYLPIQCFCFCFCVFVCFEAVFIEPLIAHIHLSSVCFCFCSCAPRTTFFIRCFFYIYFIVCIRRCAPRTTLFIRCFFFVSRVFVSGFVPCRDFVHPVANRQLIARLGAYLERVSSSSWKMLQLRRPAPRENEGEPTPRASPACGKECGKENGQPGLDETRATASSRRPSPGSKKRRQQPITGFLHPITNTVTASTGKRKPAGPESQAPCAKKSRKEAH